jgi:plasmid stability protein
MDDPTRCDGEGSRSVDMMDGRRHEPGPVREEPMTLSVHLPDDLERRLRERATREGRAVEEYVLGLIERDAAGPESARGAEAPRLSDREFETLLDELSSGPGLPHLPADFSRADIYADHD